MFQIKDLTVSVLPGREAFLGPNCRISATDPPGHPCGPRTAHPPGKTPKTPKPPKTGPPPPQKPSAACEKDHGPEKDRGPRRAAGLEDLRRELHRAIHPA